MKKYTSRQPIKDNIGRNVKWNMVKKGCKGPASHPNNVIRTVSNSSLVITIIRSSK